MQIVGAISASTSRENANRAVTLVILFNLSPKVQAGSGSEQYPAPIRADRANLPMNEVKQTSPKASDWTRLLTDPDLVTHLAELLQTYREVPANQREAALLEAMREIKDAAVKRRQARSENTGEVKTRTEAADHACVPAAELRPAAALCSPQPVEQAPPFAPDVVTSEPDRRRSPRIRCYVAVEIHIEGQTVPVWGNLINVGRGGCLVETASPVPAGKTLEIGLWVATGKIWVKGVILSGVATHSMPSFLVRVKFSQAELSEKEHLREFLKFVESSARKAQSEQCYITRLKS